MKKEIKLGFFLLAAFAVFAYFIVKTESCIEFLSKGKRYPVFAKFASVAGMYTAAPVRLSGVKIGIVEDIRLDGRKALVRMMIDNRIQLLDDARAIIATIGFVGEKYVEIVYKDEFNQPQPAVIAPGGEILTIEPFNLDELKLKFDNIYERTIQITDSINEIISDQYSKEALRDSFVNIQSITDSLKAILDENGRAGRILDDLSQIAGQLKGTVEAADHLVAELDTGIAGPDRGVLRDLREASGRIEKISADLAAISGDLRQGKGTAGRLLQDETLYKKIDDSVASVNSLLRDLEKKKRSLDAIAFNYAVHFDYFTRLRRTRPALELNVATPHFLVMTGVHADPLSGDPRFTALGGKKIAAFSVGAGLIESDLGAAVRLDLPGDRLHLDLYAYRFHREGNPLLKTILRFSLSRNIEFVAGYYDLLRQGGREFMLGIRFGD
ncbi:MAG: MCE family protein [Candidatus Aminicenantes bacterium]|nr:MCE family protein [Candidatus Aminicenantes bacterium]